MEMFSYVLGQDEDREDEQQGSDESGSGAATSLWSIAGALTATVKQRTADVLSAVQTTDWKAELSALQKGIKEEGGEAVSRAKAAAEHLPAAVEGLPENATAALRSRARSAHLQLEVASKGLGSLGHKLVQGTSELFDQISHAIQHELEPTDADAGTPRGPASAPSPEKYSRFDADVSVMQRDSSTYCDEPEDAEEFAAWQATFDLAERQRDIDRLIAENTFMRELQARIVPLIVEHDIFWTRYFYRLHRLQLKHEQIIALALRPPSPGDEEEDLGWGSADEEDEEQVEGEDGSEAGKQSDGSAAPSTDARAADGGEGQGVLSLEPLQAALGTADASSASPGESWHEVSQAEQGSTEAPGASPSQAAEDAAGGDDDLNWGEGGGATGEGEATWDSESDWE